MDTVSVTELSSANVAEYVSRVVIPHLPFRAARVRDAEEVTDQTYVNWIFAVRLEVEDGERIVYLRQTRDHVKRKPEMSMDPTRIRFEVGMLALLQGMVSGVVPVVLYFDASNNVAVLSDIKRGCPLLVHELVGGRAHPDTGQHFGRIVATVHRETWGIEHRRVRGSTEVNERAIDFHLGMRLGPARRLHADLTERLLTESRRVPHCLVLGDLASKNVFVDGDEVRFLDLERAFVWDPAFDPAFLFCHYLIEIPPEELSQSIEFIQHFMAAYRAEAEPDAGFENRLVRYLGVTLLYRLFGFYLAVDATAARTRWETRATALLTDTDAPSVEEALARLDLAHAVQPSSRRP